MNKVVKLNDRNAQVKVRQAQAQARAQFGSMVPPLHWVPLEKDEVPPGTVGAWRNPKCKVVAFEAPNPTGRPDPMICLHITEVGRELLWQELQQVQREVVGAEVEAVELFPAARRELGGHHVRYLWCLPAGQEWPVGMYPPAEMARRQRVAEMEQRANEFVNQHTICAYFPFSRAEKVEIYVDRADAAAAGRTEGLREEPLGAFPGQAPDLIWSDAARALFDRVAQELTALVDQLEAEYRTAEEAPIPEEPAAEDAPVPTVEEDAAAEAQAAADLEALRASMRKTDE
jgi:hypothetical protein